MIAMRVCYAALLLFGITFVAINAAPDYRRAFLSSLDLSKRDIAAKTLSQSPTLPVEHRPQTYRPPFSSSEPHYANPIYLPTDYGADPTGNADSTVAFELAIHALLTAPYHQLMAYNITDCGGATLDLVGGTYLLSRPLIITPYHGNIHIQRGTLRASKSFPSDSFLIEIGNITDIPPNHSQTSIENININAMMLDSSHIAAGGIRICHTMAAVIGPDVFVIKFTIFGIDVYNGHEVQIINSWLGEHYYDTPTIDNENNNNIQTHDTNSNKRLLTTHDVSYDRLKDYDSSTVAIRLLGYDHIISNVIVFRGGIGLHIIGGCHTIFNFHAWNGGTAILVEPIIRHTGSNRIIGSYLDFSNIIAIDPQRLTIVNSLFLGGAGIILQSGAQQIISGLIIKDNSFDNPFPIGFLNSDNREGKRLPNALPGISVIINETNGLFTKLHDTFIESNIFANNLYNPSTRTRLSIRLTNTTLGCMDLSTRLLFPQFDITHATLTLRLLGGSGRDKTDYDCVLTDRGSTPNERRVVCVECLYPVKQGIAYIDVDQSEYT